VQFSEQHCTIFIFVVQFQTFKEIFVATLFLFLFHYNHKMAGDLSRNDIEKAEFAFSIYDSDGSGKIDAFDIGDVLRALNCNPTLALVEKMGGKKKRGEQLLSLEEFLPIYGQVKKEKEQGCYEDFLECLKLYDKNEDGTMLLAELHHTLLALGENLTEEQVVEVFKDCMGEEDDEGNIKYAPFLQKMMIMAPLLPQ